MRILVLKLFFLPLIAACASDVDEPKHQVVVKDGAFEIREYAPVLVAEVTVKGDMGSAGNKGFRPLADFIFGNNKPAEEIEMTAPVTRKESTEIAMTAPVTRVQNSEKEWTVSFVMPEKWTAETLPEPNNPDITIREVPAETLATIRFSGRGNEKAFRENEIKLDQWINDQGYGVVGEARYAGYDAPWVLWPLRRNEVMVPVEKR